MGSKNRGVIMQRKTIKVSFSKKEVKRALKAESHLYDFISFDPRANWQEVTCGGMSPISVAAIHDGIMGGNLYTSANDDEDEPEPD